jgi:hypothetical protein
MSTHTASTIPALGIQPSYKVCVVIPAGRKKYLQLLVPQILAERGWDELRVWANTIVESDLTYIRSLPSLDQRIRIEEPHQFRPNGTKTICQFFKNCTDVNTVYIRFDDDICFIEPGTIQALSQFRYENPEPFLISPIVINNALFTYIHQVLGKLYFPYKISANCLDPIAWKSPQFAEALHRIFLEAANNSKINHFKFLSRPIAINRFSINCISWLGKEFKEFEGLVPHEEDEEEFLSVTKPTQIGKFNLFFGEKVVAHYSFFTQREYLDNTSVFEDYWKLYYNRDKS